MTMVIKFAQLLMLNEFVGSKYNTQYLGEMGETSGCKVNPIDCNPNIPIMDLVSANS